MLGKGFFLKESHALATSPGVRLCGRRRPASGTHLSSGIVGFHNFKSRNFKLSVSNPKSKYVAYVSVLFQISNCQGLGRKNKHEIWKLTVRGSQGRGFQHLSKWNRSQSTLHGVQLSRTRRPRARARDGDRADSFLSMLCRCLMFAVLFACCII